MKAGQVESLHLAPLLSPLCHFCCPGNPALRQAEEVQKAEEKENFHWIKSHAKYSHCIIRKSILEICVQNSCFSPWETVHEMFKHDLLNWTATRIAIYLSSRKRSGVFRNAEGSSPAQNLSAHVSILALLAAECDSQLSHDLQEKGEKVSEEWRDKCYLFSWWSRGKELMLPGLLCCIVKIASMLAEQSVAPAPTLCSLRRFCCTSLFKK